MVGNPGVYPDQVVKKQGKKTRRNVIIIQETTGALVKQFIPTFADEIYIEKIMTQAQNKAATSVAAFTPSFWIGTVDQTLPSATTTVTGAIAVASTVIGTTCSEYMAVKFPGTTYCNDGRGVKIEYLEE